MRKIFLLIIYLSTVLGVHAQSFTVTGKIIDNEGLEVINAKLLQKSGIRKNVVIELIYRGFI